MGQSIEKRLAGYLRERLKASKHTVKSFSQATGISTGTIDRAKRGEVSVGIDTLSGIAKGLRLKPWELLKEIDSTETIGSDTQDIRMILDVFERTDEIGRQTVMNAVLVASERMTKPSLSSSSSSNGRKHVRDNIGARRKQGDSGKINGPS